MGKDANSCALSLVSGVGGGCLLSFVSASPSTELLISCFCVWLVAAALMSSIAFP